MLSRAVYKSSSRRKNGVKELLSSCPLPESFDNFANNLFFFFFVITCFLQMLE